MNTDISAILPAKTTKTRIYAMLDAWRGFAALWVVMVHACVPQIASESPELAQSPLYAFSLWGQLGVTLFFVVSGYCIANAAHNSMQKSKPAFYFLAGRIRRIYPPYFFAFILTILLGQIFIFLASHGITRLPHHSNADIFAHNARYFVANLTITQIPLHTEAFLIVVWTLCYEVSFYAIVALALTLQSKNKNSEIVFRVIFLITGFALLWLIAKPESCPFPLDRWPQFGIGMLIFFYLLLPEQFYSRLFLFSSIGLMGLFAAFHSYGYSLAHPSSRIQSVICIVFTLLLVILYPYDRIISTNKIVNNLRKIGIFSYSLYLSHTIIQPIIHQVGKILHISSVTYWISFWAQVVASVFFARLFYSLFERPFQKHRN